MDWMRTINDLVGRIDWSIMIDLVGMLAVTGLTGSMAQLIWFPAKRALEKLGYLRGGHIGLWVVVCLYLCPVVFLGMKGAVVYGSFWGGGLFEPTLS